MAYRVSEYARDFFFIWHGDVLHSSMAFSKVWNAFEGAGISGEMEFGQWEVIFAFGTI